MKRNSKLLAFIIAFAMVLSLAVVPVSATAPGTNIAGTVTDITNNTFTAEGMIKASDAASKPEYYVANATAALEDGVIKITGRKYGDCSTGLKIKNLGLESGKTYKISVDFRRDSDVYCNLGTDTDRDGVYDYSNAAGSQASDSKVVDNIMARIVFSNITGSNASVGTSELAATTLSNQNQWYTLSTEVTVAENAEGTGELGVNLGFKVGRNSNNNTFDYSVRDLTVTEVNPVVDDLPTGVDVLSYCGFDGSFESKATDATSVSAVTIKHPDAAAGAQAATLSNIKVTTDAANSGTKSAETTSTSESNRLRITYVPVDAGSFYEISAYVKLKEAPASGDAVTARFGVSASGSSLVTASVKNSGNSSISASGFTKITGVIAVAAKDSPATTDVNSYVHIAIDTYKNNNKSNAETIYVDDWTITELPAFTATLSESALGADSAKINVAFSAAPASFTEDNVSVDGATVAVSGSGTSYTISLTGLASETAYTVALTGVEDAYAQTASGSITVTTTSYVAPITGTVDVATSISQAGSRTSHLITKVTDGEWTVEKNAGTNLDSYTEAQRTTDNVQRTSYAVKEGKKYVITAMVKNEDASPASTATANITFGESGDSAHNIDGVPNGNSDKYSIASNNWVEVMGVVVINDSTVTCDCSSTCAKAKSVAHYGVQTSADNTKFSVKNLTIRELAPLSLDNTYEAFTVDNGDGTATLYITNGTSATIFFVAAVYGVEGELLGVKFGSALADKNGGMTKIEVPENYKVMIWDSNLKPLHNTFLGSDF